MALSNDEQIAVMVGLSLAFWLGIDALVKRAGRGGNPKQDSKKTEEPHVVTVAEHLRPVRRHGPQEHTA